MTPVYETMAWVERSLTALLGIAIAVMAASIRAVKPTDKTPP